MALIAKHYTWNRQEIDPYARIESKEITSYKEDGVKKYQVNFLVHIYTTDDKMRDYEPLEFEIKDVSEAITLFELYENLKTRPYFKDWIDA